MAIQLYVAAPLGNNSLTGFCYCVLHTVTGSVHALLIMSLNYGREISPYIIKLVIVTVAQVIMVVHLSTYYVPEIHGHNYLQQHLLSNCVAHFIKTTQL